jgi:cholesterol transport system auxiliary component
MTRLFRSCAPLLAALLLGLGACSGLLPFADEQEPPAIYFLDAPQEVPGAPVAIDRQILIEEPLVPRMLDTERIAVQSAPLEVTYYADSLWADRPSAMLQRLLVQTFENNGAFAGVGIPGRGLRPDYVLLTELRAFQAELTPGQRLPLVRVRIHAQLVRDSDGRIVASRDFEQVVPATATDVRAVVHAFDAAVDQVLSDIVSWSLAAPGTV